MIKKQGVVFYLVLLMLLHACALKVAPTGGPKDVIPPIVKKYEPENLSTNFSEKEITIGFNEFIQLKELDKQLIISPIIKPAPQITVRGKNIVIELKKELLPNTTYTFNFGNAIVDLHEGNAVEDFRYVISTGNFVDTLHIDGKVYAAQDLKTEKGILVMLYNTNVNNDSLPYQQVPDFFTRTDAEGNFSIRNISKGPYKVFALKDADADYKFNSADEQIGFINEPVFADDTVKHQLKLFKEIPEKLFVKKSFYANKAKVTVVFNKSADVAFESMNGTSDWKFIEKNLSRDSISIWLADTLTDSLSLIVRTNNVVIDRLQIRNVPVNLKASRTNSGLAFAISSASASINPAMSLSILSSLPLTAIDTSKIILKEDSATIVTYKLVFTDSIKRTLLISSAWKEKKMYTLQLLPGAAQSIYGLTNDTTNIPVTVNSMTDYGSVKIKLAVADSSQYIMQLTTDADVPVYEKIISGNGEFVFENCIAAKYKLRVIKDDDGNKQFTTGKYMSQLQPEKVYYYKESVNIRANWDIEIDWALIKK